MCRCADSIAWMWLTSHGAFACHTCGRTSWLSASDPAAPTVISAAAIAAPCLDSYCCRCVVGGVGFQCSQSVPDFLAAGATGRAAAAAGSSSSNSSSTPPKAAPLAKLCACTLDAAEPGAPPWSGLLLMHGCGDDAATAGWAGQMAFALQ